MRSTNMSAARSSLAPSKSLVAAVALSLAALGGFAAEAPPALPIPGYEVITSPEEATGDVPGIIKRWIAVLKADPDTPQAELMLRRMTWMSARVPGLETLLPEVDAILAKNPRRGEVRTLLTLTRARLLRMKGSWAEAAKAEAGLAAATRWIVIGPFGARPAVDHYRAYPPESEVDLSATYEGSRGSVGWTMSPRKGPGLTMIPTGLLRPMAGVSYCLAQVQSDEERDAYVHLNVRGSWKLWIGGVLAHEADESLDWIPAKAIVRVRLAKGWNRLLIKCPTSPGAISCRLTDRQAVPLSGIVFEDKKVLHPQAKGASALPYGAAPLECALEHYRSALPDIKRGLDPAARRREACDRASLAMITSILGLHDESIEQIDVAVGLWPDSPHLQSLRGEVISMASHLPQSDRKNRARESFEKAAAAPGGFAPASQALARQLLEDDKAEAALAMLKSAFKKAPTSYLIKEQMAGIALKRKWRNEAHKWMLEAERIAPAHAAVRQFWAGFYGAAGNNERRLAELRQLLRRDRSGGPARAVASALSRRGEFDGALRLLKELLEHDPDSLELRTRIAHVLSASGRNAEAAAELDALAKLVPGEASYPKMLGNIYTRMGKADDAIASYRRSLAVNPGQHGLRRHLQHLTGTEIDFSKPFPVDLAKELSRVGDAAKYPGASKVRVLDQTVSKIYADGSRTDIVHNAEKILTEKGVGSLSDIYVPGEILEARTLLPDGTVLEPTMLEAGGSLTMPGLRIGATVEWKYRIDSGAAGYRKIKLSPWFFRAPDFHDPHHLSRYVVLIPKDLDAEVIKQTHNWRRSDGKPLGVPPAETRGDYVVHRWVARDTKRLEPERSMPHRNDLLPYVVLATQRGWDEVAYGLAGRELGRIKLTRDLRAASKKAVGEAKTVRDKVHAVYRYVNELIKNDRGGYSAHEVLATRSGDRGILMLALLRAAGIDATYCYTRPGDVFVSNDGAAPANWSMPDANIFPQSSLVAFDEDGLPIFFDPTNRFLEFGYVPMQVRGSPVLVPRAGGAFFCSMPGASVASEGSVTRTEMTVAADRSASGVRAEKRFGIGAAYRKDAYKGFDLPTRKRIAQRALNTIFPGVEVAAVKLPGLDEIETPFRVSVDLKAPNFVRLRGKLANCTTGMSRLKLVERFGGAADRKMPMKFGQAIIGRDVAVLSFAAGWTPAKLPENVALRNRYGSYVLNVEAMAGGRVKIVRAYSIEPQVMGAADYTGGFILWARSVDRADAVEIELKKAE